MSDWSRLCHLVNRVSNLARRQRLVPLKEDARGVLDTQFGEKIVVLREDQSIVFAGVPGDRLVLGTDSEFCDVLEAFDGAHLFSMVVVVRERPVDVGHVNTVTVGDRPRFEAALLDLRFDELDGDSSAFEMRPVVWGRFAQATAPSRATVFARRV